MEKPINMQIITNLCTKLRSRMFKYVSQVFLVNNKRIFHVETRLGHFTAWAQGRGISCFTPLRHFVWNKAMFNKL